MTKLCYSGLLVSIILFSEQNSYNPTILHKRSASDSDNCVQSLERPQLHKLTKTLQNYKKEATSFDSCRFHLMPIF